MPIKLIPQLRFLNPSLPVTRLLPIKITPASINLSSRAAPIISQIFPFKLTYSTLGPQSNSQPGFRRFSTRSLRSRPGGSGSQLSRGGRGRGEAGASKSLIEDEAELSDWVGDLKTNSLASVRFDSEDESESGKTQDNNRFKGGRDTGRVGGRDTGRGGERGRYTGRGGERGRDTGRGGERGRDTGDREGFSMKRRSESDPVKFGESNRKTRAGQVEPFPRSLPGKKQFGGGFDKNGERFNSRVNKNGERFNSRNSGNDTGRFNSGRNNSGNVGSMNGKWGRGGVDFRSKRDEKGLRGKTEIVDDSEDNENFDDIVGDEEEEERKGLMGNLGDLMAEEESDDDDDGILKENAASSLGLQKEFKVKERPSSPGNSESYLSETRYVK